MPRPSGTGLKPVRKKLADGSIREYFYNRATKENYGTDRAIAEARIQEYNAAGLAAMGRPVAPTLEQLITDYLRTDAYRSKKPRTREIYRHYLDQLRARFGAFRVASFTPARIEHIKLDLQDQPSKCNHTLAMLRLVFNLAIKLGYCPTNPVVSVGKVSLPPRTAIWSPTQIDAFLDAARPSLRLAMLLMLYSAQRPSDVLEMTRNRVAERSGRLYIALRQGKTDELLDVPVHSSLETLLRTRLADGSGGLLLVPSPTGRPWPRRNFSRAWDATRRKAGLPPLQRRDLRRTAVVFMAQAGLTVGQIAAITGHRIESTTAILNTYLPRRTDVALTGIEQWEKAGVVTLPTVVTLAAERERRERPF